MARKVFISILGTGFYASCHYATGDFTSSLTPFIQQATLELLDAKHWTANDAVCILLTQSARKLNWTVEGNKRKNFRTQSEEPYTGLRDLFEAMGLPMSPTEVDIPDGKDEAEMWEIFDTLFNLVEEGDEVHLDLTHSFRSLPMLLLVWSNYAKFLKHVKVASICYGNYEVRDQATNVAPIIDLLPLSLLQDWTFATANFLKNGNMNQLSQLCGDQLRPILKATRGRDTDATNLRRYIGALQQMTDDMRFVRGTSLYEANNVHLLKERGQALDQVIIKPLAPIVEQISLSLAPFSEQAASPTNGLQAARWCLSKGLYQAAVTHLFEGVVTYFAVRHGLRVDKEGERGAVNRAFKLLYFKRNPGKGIYRLSDSAQLEQWVDELTHDSLLQDEAIVDDFVQLETLRNDFNHAGMKDNARSVTKLEKEVSQKVDRLTRALLLPPLLLNLSNHPFSEWSPLQLKAARAFGQCQDYAFPTIQPTATEEDIAQLAQATAEAIRPLALTHTLTVHVMGEMGFTFSLVKILQRWGIRCIYSTSQRIAETLPDGSKRSTFHFERFREYERL